MSGDGHVDRLGLVDFVRAGLGEDEKAPRVAQSREIAARTAEQRAHDAIPAARLARDAAGAAARKER